MVLKDANDLRKVTNGQFEDLDISYTEGKKMPELRTKFAWSFTFPDLFIHGGQAVECKAGSKPKLLKDLWHLNVVTK